MASILTLQNTINWCRPYLKQQPFDVTNTEPAVTSANNVLGVMVGPPMIWRFNRNMIQIPVTAAATDYAIVVSDFGSMEDLWLEDATGKMHSVEGAISLPRDSANPSRPKQVSPQYDDNQGTITFRVKPIPNTDYTIFIDYQKKLVPLESWASPWAPVPDEFQYIFNLGFKAEMAQLTNDARFPIWQRDFVARLLSAQDGLDEQAKAIFLGQFEAFTASLTRAAGRVQTGTNARGSQ